MKNIDKTILLLIRLIVVYSLDEKYSCAPCNCTSTEGSVHVDCTEIMFTDVPKFCTANVTTFSLCVSSIGRIRNYAFVKCARLKTLSMRKSPLHLLEVKAFQGLSCLQSLDLSDNDLGSDSGQLKEADAFKPLTSLETLDLSQNFRLSNNNFLILRSLMHSLPKSTLKRLILKNVVLPFQQSGISTEFLESISTESLTHLDLSCNGITAIDGGIAEFTPNLEELDLSSNKLVSFTSLFSLSRLRRLYISHQGNWVKKHAYPRVLTREENYQNYSQNYSFIFNEDTKWNMNRTGRRNIHGQNLGNKTYRIPWPTNLSVIKAQHVRRAPIVPHVRFYVLNEEHMEKVSIDLSNNDLFGFSSPIELQYPGYGVSIDISNNKLHSFSKEAFGKNFTAALEKLNMSNNKLGNMFAKIDDPLPQFNNLKHLDLSYNRIFYLSNKFFNRKNSPKLESLVLKKNRLAVFPECINTFKSLKTLDLSNNVLVNFPACISDLKFLTTLDLSNNVLSDIQVCISALKSLTTLDLSANRLFFWKRDLVSELINTFKAAERDGRNLTMDLSGNPFECSCTFFDFLKFISTFQKRFTNIENMRCSLSGKQTTLSRLHSDILPVLEKQCLSLRWLYVTTSCLVILAVCLSLSVIAYRHRWDIKYFCLRLRIRRELYAELFEEDGAFQYDAFVAYNERDLPWVDTHLVANLEGGVTPFRLCFHHRDFEIGWPIEENILRSISTSRKTIIVLSRHFIRSGWCKFEMHMARIHMMERGVDKLIVILLEEIPTTDMPRTLVAIMRRHTYLVWPGQDMIHNVPAFWSRLRSALSKRHGN